MEARRRKLVVLFIAAIALVAPAAAPAFASAGRPGPVEGPAADGTAEGTFTVNGTAYPLKYAYASAQPAFFDKTKEDIHVLLSDVPLAPEQREDVFAISRLAREGKAHVIEVVLDAERRPISGSFFTLPFESMVSATGMHVFEPQAFEHKRIAGRLYTDGARRFGSVTYEYTATFSAPIPRPPTTEETAAALASPPGRAAAAFLSAIHGNDLTAFVSLLGEPAAAAYRGSEAPSAFAALKTDTPRDSKVVGLTTPTENTAVATINGTRDGIVIESLVELALVDGKWKVVKLQ